MSEGFAHYRLEDFKAGDRVRHIKMNEVGTVHAVGETVDVVYDRKGKNGTPWSGSYNRNWFKQVGLLVKV